MLLILTGNIPQRIMSFATNVYRRFRTIQLDIIGTIPPLYGLLRRLRQQTGALSLGQDFPPPHNIGAEAPGPRTVIGKTPRASCGLESHTGSRGSAGTASGSRG